MAKSKKVDLSRCVGCSKPILRSTSRKDPGDEVAEIQVGSLLKDNEEEKAPFRRKRVWGRMHMSCFKMAVGAPDLIDDLEI